MKAVIALTMVLLLGTIGFLLLFFASLAASLAIGESLGSDTGGFLVVALIYLVLGVLAYAFRRKLETPVLKSFSKHYFDE